MGINCQNKKRHPRCHRIQINNSKSLGDKMFIMATTVFHYNFSCAKIFCKCLDSMLVNFKFSNKNLYILMRRNDDICDCCLKDIDDYVDVVDVAKFVFKSNWQCFEANILRKIILMNQKSVLNSF